MGEKQIEIIVKDYMRTLKNNKIAVEQAILYGSQAANTASAISRLNFPSRSISFS